MFDLGRALARMSHLGKRGFYYFRAYGALATIRKFGHLIGSRHVADLLGYGVWTRFYGRLSTQDRKDIRAHIDTLGHRPLISVVMPVYNPPPQFLRRAIDSVINQLYPNWELCIADDASPDRQIPKILAEYVVKDPRIRLVRREANGRIAAATNTALSIAQGDFVAFMDHDDEISELALYMVAVEINQYPEADLIYSDEDKIDEQGRFCNPFFKPEWNVDQFYSQNFLNHLCVIRKQLVDEARGCRLGFEGSQDYDLILRLIERIPSDHIRHIPLVLYHWRWVPSSFSKLSLEVAIDAAQRALAEHFERRGQKIAISAQPSAKHHLRVHYPLPDPPPKVTAIIPTRDHCELLRQCIDGLLRATDYPDLEVIIVDNGSTDAVTLDYLAGLTDGRIKVLRYDRPFNYSAINNFAAAQATGAVIALLNNDIKMIHADWLGEMVAHALRPEVGAVGAMLYYPDGSIQHAGVVTGLGGVAGHIHQAQSRIDVGNYDFVNVVREVSCVTAACMVLRRDVFEEVGGLDADGLPVAFNDVDLCLRIRAKGYRIIWTPNAELYHLESASRGQDVIPEKIERFRREYGVMRERWGPRGLAADPYYSPNLSLDGCSGDLAFPPRVVLPWRHPGDAGHRRGDGIPVEPVT